MTDIFIVNPKAALDEIGEAVDDRIGQARAVCQYATANGGGSSGKFIENTFWAVDALLKDAETLNAEIHRRAVKKQRPEDA